MMEHNNTLERPAWIRGKVSWDGDWEKVRSLLNELSLSSVCVEAACPNKGECWEARHVTFMILGDICTRGCLFCNVEKGDPAARDPREPANIAKAVKELGLKYVVITSVTRDDLPDRGAGHFVETVREIRSSSEDVLIELLIPDLDADPDILKEIAFSGASVVGHNIEMPEALYGRIRPRAGYSRSLKTLEILSSMKNNDADILVKSAIMVGLGEKTVDVIKTLEDLKNVGVDIMYMGQYLSPSRSHWDTDRFYTPEEFAFLEEKAVDMGFKAVLAGPMVRSSYRAYGAYLKCKEVNLTRP